MREPAGFEITSADLTVRQNTSPILDSVPLWMIRHICSQESRRGPKIPEYSAGYTSYKGGGYSPTGHWEGNHYVQGCWSDTSGCDSWALANAAKARAKRMRKESKNSPSDTEKGNLPEQDYRFWEGSRGYSKVVKCRWCGKRCDTLEERVAHFRGLESKNCSKLLRILYEASVEMAPRYCFVCSKQTRASRWGIPMCNDDVCITRWKFDCYDLHREMKRRIEIVRNMGSFRIHEGLKTI